jgi:hypothetical protein
MKKIKQNTVRINNNELQKCKLGQEFKVDVITHVKSKPTPPVPPNGSNGGGKRNEPPKPHMTLVKLADMFQSFEERNNSRLDRIESRLDGIDARLIKVETRLDIVIKLNNLKTE